MELALWIIGGLITLVGILGGVAWRDMRNEIHILRDWRHKEVDAAIRYVGFLKERMERLEKKVFNGEKE